jgi:dienelactone hydrolase
MQDHSRLILHSCMVGRIEQVEEHYEAQSNYTIADQLEGKLLIAHGDLDDNVPLPASIKLVDALIKADKDFDFLVMPGRNHGFGNEPYFVRCVLMDRCERHERTHTTTQNSRDSVSSI